MVKKTQSQLSHLDAEGRLRMVDVGAKAVTARTAEASGFVAMSPTTVAAIRQRRTPKGDPLEAARLAGIMAAKRTAELIPLCHPLGLDHVEVKAALAESLPGVTVWARVRTVGRTGVEMEALTAVSVALLTVYDMVKAVDDSLVIGDVQLVEKQKAPVDA